MHSVPSTRHLPTVQRHSVKAADERLQGVDTRLQPIARTTSAECEIGCLPRPAVFLFFSTAPQ
jgi:hypothetical protein